MAVSAASSLSLRALLFRAIERPGSSRDRILSV